MNICVFCGSSPGYRPEYAAAARELGALLAHRGLGLVYGGGKVGLMGEVADAALAAGGHVLGVIPESLQALEVGHDGLSELHVVQTMHERKALMADRSDAFMALPGGFGTLDESCEILTWAQLGLHAKPFGLVNLGGYYDAFLAFLDHSVREGFLRHFHRSLILSEPTPAATLDRLLSARVQPMPKWIDAGDR